MTKMIDNELNRVVGGDGYETAFDSIALFGKGYLDKPFCQWDLITHWVTNSGKVDAAWAGWSKLCYLLLCQEQVL